jgi:uncharacterized protein
MVCSNEMITFVKDYMKQFDSSHDFEHVSRVYRLAMYIFEHECKEFDLNLELIELACYMHEVGDHKYHSHDVVSTLESLGIDTEIAQKVQLIIDHVGFTKESSLKSEKDFKEYNDILLKYPEIRVVQDADRLDALGAIGIARTFTYAGAKHYPLYGTQNSCLTHFDDKLQLLESMMKTRTGAKLAKKRSERLLLFKEWMNQEINTVEIYYNPM